MGSCVFKTDRLCNILIISISGNGDPFWAGRTSCMVSGDHIKFSPFDSNRDSWGFIIGRGSKNRPNTFLELAVSKRKFPSMFTLQIPGYEPLLYDLDFNFGIGGIQPGIYLCRQVFSHRNKLNVLLSGGVSMVLSRRQVNVLVTGTDSITNFTTRQKEAFDVRCTFTNKINKSLILCTRITAEYELYQHNYLYAGIEYFQGFSNESSFYCRYENPNFGTITYKGTTLGSGVQWFIGYRIRFTKFKV